MCQFPSFPTLLIQTPPFKYYVPISVFSDVNDSLFIIALIYVWGCVWSLFCDAVHGSYSRSSFAIVSLRKKSDLIYFVFSLSCALSVVCLFLAVL